MCDLIPMIGATLGAVICVLAEQLHERDAAGADSGTSGDHEAVVPAGPADEAGPATDPRRARAGA